MNKVIAGALTIFLSLLGFVSLSFATIGPASASVPDKVTICHANEGKKGYTSNTVSKHAVVKKTNEGGGHGLHEDDIIPPFDYNFGGSDYGTYPGQNWPATGGEQFIANGCATPEPVDERKQVAPPVATYNPGTCASPNGSVSYTLTDGSVLNYGPKLVGDLEPAWVVDFDPAEGFKYAEGITGTYTFPVVGPGPGDEFWDETKGSCNLPDTGLFGLSDEATYLGGGLLILGVLFVVGSAITQRRTA